MPKKTKKNEDLDTLRMEFEIKAAFKDPVFREEFQQKWAKLIAEGRNEGDVGHAMILWSLGEVRKRMEDRENKLDNIELN